MVDDNQKKPNQAEREQKQELHQELPIDSQDPFFRALHRIIYERLNAPPFMLLDINDIFYTFGAFMAVLIAVEIFINIRLYLGTNVFPVQLVVATALMAIARKVIVLDFETLTPMYLLGIAATTLALGITYWLLKQSSQDHGWHN